LVPKNDHNIRVWGGRKKLWRGVPKTGGDREVEGEKKTPRESQPGKKKKACELPDRRRECRQGGKNGRFNEDREETLLVG